MPTRRQTIAGLATAALVASRRADAAEHTLRLSSWGSPTGPQVAVFTRVFTKAVEDGSKGRIAVQAFPAGSLVKEQDVPSAIQSHVVDISLSTIGGWASVSPAAALIGSILFRPTAKSFLATIGAGSKLANALDQSLRKRHVRLLASLDNGPPMLVSRAPVQKPADMKGKPFRAYDRGSSQIIRALGGAPSTMRVSDVYAALQRGTVEGALGGIQGALGLKEYEVAKYLLNGNGVWGVGTTLYVMNGAALAGLPAELQAVVLEAGRHAEQVTNKALFAFIANGVKEMAKHGMTVTELEPGTAPYQAFATALAPLARAQAKNIPKELLAMVGGHA